MDTAASPPAPGYHTLPVEFSGSGGEYFRIWIVNLLLLILTLGLYWPWAKVRRMRYFWGNTLVDGEPLAFHGEPRKMFRGQALVGVLLLLYSWAGQASPLAGLVALVALAGLWPALFRASMQFRLANTSWRGLRMRFTGSMPGAYAAVLPLFAPAALLGAVALAADPASQALPLWAGLASLGLILLSVGLLPRLWWQLKSYQHRHYGIGQVQTGFRAPLGSFYHLVFKGIGLAMLISATTAVLLLMLPAMLLPQRDPVLMIALMVGFNLVNMLLLVIILLPWWQTRMQNLLWTETGSAQVRFISRLKLRDMLRLQLKNWLLIVLTLGFYWPYAAVSMARLKLEALRIRSRVSTEALLAGADARQGDAAGEAAGDLLGIDAGF